MKLEFTSASLLVLLCLACALPTHAESMGSRVWQEKAAIPAPTLLAPLSAPAHRVALAAPSEAERQMKRAQTAPTSGAPRPPQIGFNRSLTQAQRSIDVAHLPWQQTSDGGQVAHISVQSRAAAAVRVRVSVTGSGGGEIRFASPTDAHEVYGPFAVDGQVWSPLIEGDTLLLELRLLPGRDVSAVSLTLDTLAHIEPPRRQPRNARTPAALNIGSSDACEVDFVCTSNATPALLSVGKAVAKMVFTTKEGTFMCSGTLLSSSNPALPPYFYTANHCIGSQAEADAITTFWFFEAPVCNGNTAPNHVQLPGGALLLYHDAPTDVSLVKFNQRPPAGAVYAGWSTDTVLPGTPLVGIHHPAGDLKKISRGRSYGYGDFDGDTGALIPGSDNKILLSWTVFGETEGGSSGSGIFVYNAALDQYQLRGGLFGGSGVQCAGPVQDSFYSRFDRAFPALKPFLSP